MKISARIKNNHTLLQNTKRNKVVRKLLKNLVSRKTTRASMFRTLNKMKSLRPKFRMMNFLMSVKVTSLSRTTQKFRVSISLQFSPRMVQDFLVGSARKPERSKFSLTRKKKKKTRFNLRLLFLNLTANLTKAWKNSNLNS